MGRLSRGFFLAAIAAALASALAACGGSDPRPVDVSALQAADGPPAYWLGERFEGLALAANAGTTNRPNFVYGTCEPAGSDGGCAPPLQLQHWPLAERAPEAFRVTPGRRASCRRLPAGGVTAAVFETTGGVEVYLGDRVVVLFGEPGLIRKALTALRPLRPQTPALPSPPRTVVEALARCASPSPGAIDGLLAAGGEHYWVGRSIDGHPLVSVEGDAEEARLLYGECARDALASDAACWAPLELRTLPLQSPGAYAASVPCRLRAAQGAPAALLASAHTLDVFAGRRPIRLIGPDLALLERAAEELRPLGTTRAQGLPPPSPELGRALRDRCPPG